MESPSRWLPHAARIWEMEERGYTDAAGSSDGPCSLLRQNMRRERWWRRAGIRMPAEEAQRRRRGRGREGRVARMISCWRLLAELVQGKLYVHSFALGRDHFHRGARVSPFFSIVVRHNPRSAQIRSTPII